MVFPGVQKTTWTYNRQARQYYFHRFYKFQPDLNTQNKAVRNEITKIMGFWLELGVSGFRMDAVPFLIERKGAGAERGQDFEFLHEMREFLQWRCGDAILMAEANVPPDESMPYFGANGDNLQMMLNFPVNQRLFYALATGDIRPLCWALENTAARPPAAQWVHFLRTHDELDLGRLTDEHRQRVYEAFAPTSDMHLYDRGIRRRLAPMLGNDRLLELAFSLLFSLPGTPMVLYGDEIGMGDDLSLPERECTRTPMQWTGECQGGFSRARKLIAPVVADARYGYRKVNVAQQRHDPDSLLSATERMIKTRRECPEISWGQFTILKTNAPEVLALRYDWRNTSLLTLHNFAGHRRKVRLEVGTPNGKSLVNVVDGCPGRGNGSSAHEINLEAYGYRWFRVGTADHALDRTAL
jgi:maltose alpha-D-glucosyltransferase/alpha-amylase